MSDTVYITTRDAFDHRAVFVRKGEEITFPEGAEIPKWVVPRDKFKPDMVPAEPKVGDTKPIAAALASAKTRQQKSDLA